MVKKKTLTKLEVVSMYMEYIEVNGKQPKSILEFSEKNGFSMDVFKKHFKSFKTLESTIFKLFLKNTLEVLDKSEDYTFFDQRYKLLTFYYTFFEVLNANRPYVIKQFEVHKTSLNSLKMLAKLRKGFIAYIHNLNIDTIDLKQDTLNKVQHKSLAESAWIQLLLTLKFWMDDNSSSFEKTDVFIEKFVNTSFDLINTKPLKSLIDLGKFLIKEKIQF